MATPNIDTIRDLGARYSNWGRWGPDDERGTLNYVEPKDVISAARLVRTGKSISLAIPFDEDGPQTGNVRRFNPIHLMIRDGSDAISGASLRDYYKVEKYFRGTDDIVIMPLQCGTQWDALAHVIFENKIYNGYSADQVSSLGAMRNSVANGSNSMVGRGVLLDLPKSKGVRWLEPGYAISSSDLEQAARKAGVSIKRGDHLMVRTGALTKVRDSGDWGPYAMGDAPGMGLSSVEWIAEHQIAALATDTYAMEVLPCETADVAMPLHIIFLVYMGLWVGEIWDLEALASECAADGTYEFMFCGPPLPFTRAVGSPVVPVAIK